MYTRSIHKDIVFLVTLRVHVPDFYILVPRKLLWGYSIFYLGTWTLRVTQAKFRKAQAIRSCVPARAPRDSGASLCLGTGGVEFRALGFLGIGLGFWGVGLRV